VANALLALFKAAVGIMSHSIAITLDSVNNLSDAASSVITIIGTKLALKPADKKHPFGYGRIEYLSAMLIALIILYAGVTSLVESVKKIIHPVLPEYSRISIIILIVAVVVKIAMGLYVLHNGKKVNSDSLVASGKDALTDSIISFATIIAAVVFMIFGVAVEAYLGAVISLVILKAGFETLHDSISEILGQRVDSQLARDIKKTISEVDSVRGVYDLTLTNYGPDSFIASVHIALDADTPVSKADKVQRKVADAVYSRYGILISAVGIYPADASTSLTQSVKEKIGGYLSQFPQVLEMHGLYVDDEDKVIRMDVIIDFDYRERIQLYNKIQEGIASLFPDYRTSVHLDLDVSSL
jgi:cation diffusion facilitator family transporter